MCVYECRHPWYGGHGECSPEKSCDCDLGFTAHDDLQQAACVPTRFRIVVHWLTCCAALLTVAHAYYRYRRQTAPSTAAKIHRARDSLRCLLYTLAAAWGACTSIIFALKAALDIPFKVMSLVFIPSMLFLMTACWVLLLLWIATLPRKLLLPGSIGYKVDMAANNKSTTLAVPVLFCSAAVTGCIVGGAVGRRPIIATRILHSTTLIVCIGSLVVIDLVCWSIFSVVRSSSIRSNSSTGRMLH
jgi:hypothetical protein